jgi:hypothetical protein
MDLMLLNRQRLPRKQLEVPPALARNFVKHMRAYHAEVNAIKRAEIAARQLHALKQFKGPRDKKLRFRDNTRMFEEMKDR